MASSLPVQRKDGFSVIGKSKRELGFVIDKYCEKYRNAPNNKTSSMAAADLCDQLYIENHQKLYVIITDVEFQVVAEGWTTNAEGEQEEDKDKVAQKGDKIVWKYLVSIGSFEYTLYVFSPVHATFTLKKNVAIVGSVFYHGNCIQSLGTRKVMRDGYQVDPNMIFIVITFHYVPPSESVSQ